MDSVFTFEAITSPIMWNTRSTNSMFMKGSEVMLDSTDESIASVDCNTIYGSWGRRRHVMNTYL